MRKAFAVMLVGAALLGTARESKAQFAPGSGMYRGGFYAPSPGWGYARTTVVRPVYRPFGPRWGYGGGFVGRQGYFPGARRGGYRGWAGGRRW